MLKASCHTVGLQMKDNTSTCVHLFWDAGEIKNDYQAGKGRRQEKGISIRFDPGPSREMSESKMVDLIRHYV